MHPRDYITVVNLSGNIKYWYWLKPAARFTNKTKCSNHFPRPGHPIKLLLDETKETISRLRGTVEKRGKAARTTAGEWWWGEGIFGKQRYTSTGVPVTKWGVTDRQAGVKFHRVPDSRPHDKTVSQPTAPIAWPRRSPFIRYPITLLQTQNRLL